MISTAYEKNRLLEKVFLLPTVKAGKSFIDKTNRLLNEWAQDSPLKSIAFTTIMVMPSLLLQKPSKTSKAKDHSEALVRRLRLWRQGDISELVREGETIQNQLPDSLQPKQIGKISVGLLADDHPQKIHPVFFDQINVETIRKAALRTNGGSRPSNLDAEGCY